MPKKFAFRCLHLERKKKKTFDVGLGMRHVDRAVEHRSAFTEVVGRSRTQHLRLKKDTAVIQKA